MSIPTKAAEDIAKNFDYDQVIIIARKVGQTGSEYVTTYGVSKIHCEIAERIGNFFKHKFMAWSGK